LAPEDSPESEGVHVVTLDTGGSHSADWNGYKANDCNPDYWKSKIVDHPKMTCIKSEIAALCGLNLKVYFTKMSPGIGMYEGQGDPNGLEKVLRSGAMQRNNGAATFLCCSTATGLSNWIVTGKAYVVCDDGATPLSAERVWGIVEMINCAMDIYDMDPEAMRKVQASLEKWGAEYQKGTWQPSSGNSGLDIYK
jgi:hypothetical protein